MLLTTLHLLKLAPEILNALGLVATVLKTAATSSCLCCQPFAFSPLKNSRDPAFKLKHYISNLHPC